jgi:hypothetical protein
MKQQDKDPLDKLFASLAEPSAQTPSAAYLQDLEARLDALAQKRRKPFGILWFWSALGAILSIGILAYWQREASSSLASKPQKMEQKTQRFSDANNAKVATFHLNSSKLNSSISLNTSILTSSPSHLNISSLNTPPIFSHLPSEVAPVTDFHSIESSSLHNSVPSDILAIQTIAKTENQEILETITTTIDTNNGAKTNLAQTSTSIVSAPITPPKPLKKYTHLVGLQFGVSGIFSSFEVPSTLTTVPEPLTPKEFREWRELGERQTSSWDFNLRYQLFFGKWGLQTGLNYLEWGEQYTYEVISVEGTNRYQYVQIPLGLTCQIPMRQVLFQPAIGLAMGYGINRDGAYILPGNNGVAVVESKKWAANAYAQLEFVYQANKQMQFSITPVFRYSLGNIIEHVDIKNRYQSVGLLTGFSFSF